MAASVKRNKSSKDPRHLIQDMLGQVLPSPDNASEQSIWLKAVATATRRQFDASNDDEITLGKAILESFGGTWTEEDVSNDGLSDKAMDSLADFIGLHLTLQESAGLPKQPFLSAADLWSEIHDRLRVQDQLFDAGEVNSDQASPYKAVLAAVMQVSGPELSAEFFNAIGYPTKAAQQEVLAYLTEIAKSDASQDDSDNVDDEQDEDPLEIATDLALCDRPVDGSPESQSLDTLMLDVGAGLLQLDPPWQRGDVWGLRKKRALIDSVMLGIPLPSLIFHKRRNESGQTITVIDGKQRLTALYQFYDNQWRLGRYPAGSPLHPLSGKAFAGLSNEQRSKFKRTQITCIHFENLPSRVLYRIFELYNISGIRLNATEIRNAVFHDHPIHRMLFSLAGESAATEQYIADQQAFTTLLRNTLSTRGNPPRFSTVDFLERYLAYSRVPRDFFTPVSTTKVVQAYFEDPEFTVESPTEIATELRTVFMLAYNLYAAAGSNAFAVPSGAGRRLKFSKLRATTSLVLARLVSLVRKSRSLDDDQAVAAIREVEALVPYPDKQQTRSIWGYQARCVTELIRSLSLTHEDLCKCGAQRFVSAMQALALVCQ